MALFPHRTMVPHLTTALTGPLLELERRILDNDTTVEKWLRTQWLEHTPPFYGSVDLRNSGFKLAPVDTNLFPGGFNNLNDAFLPLCVQAAMSAIEKICPEARNLLLVPENHTRNQFYLMNVARLATILHHTGLNVRIGSLLPEITEAHHARPARRPEADPGTAEAPAAKAAARPGRLRSLRGAAQQRPVGGVPPVLENIHEQFLIPPLWAGWHVRRKSKHFAAYQDVAIAFAGELGIDPWLINPEFEVCGKVNFQERTGEECLAANIDSLLYRMRAKYKEYGIETEPFVIVKADAGTYGMGIMTVKDASEVKASTASSATRWRWSRKACRCRGHHPGRRADLRDGRGRRRRAGGLHDRPLRGGRLLPRQHRARPRREPQRARHALQAAGLRHRLHLPDAQLRPDAPPNRFYAYGVVARLACWRPRSNSSARRRGSNP
jgi:glutamate--cysteine ligase